jgi:hypothetical protein
MRSIRISAFVCLTVVAGLMLAQPAVASNFSFTGNFTQDDNIQLFTFSVGATSTVTLRTWSYAGGTNAAGQLIASDGFDPILALFDSTGALIGQNDDGGCGQVSPDAETGACFDTYFSALLNTGTYSVTVMQYANFAIGPNYSNGFLRQGQGNFTGAAYCGGASSPFWDVTCDQNDGHWAFDILNVNAATASPEPGTMLMVGTGLLGAVGMVRRRIGKF